jgi:hypothetical protein
MISSADPFFSSRSSMRRSISVIATYGIDGVIRWQVNRRADSVPGAGLKTGGYVRPVGPV